MVAKGNSTASKSKGKPQKKGQGEVGDSQAQYSLAFFVFLAAAALGAACHYFRPSREVGVEDASSPELKPWRYRIKAKVERVKWSPEKPVVKPMLELKEPRVLMDTFAARWPAATIRQWSPSYLDQKLPETLQGVYTNTNPIFGPLWRPKSPRTLAAVQGANLTGMNPFSVRSMKKREFLDRISSENKTKEGVAEPEEYAYYTGDLGTKSLIEDVQPIRELVTADGSGNTAKVNVWVGEKGVETSLHADTYNNFYVQLWGRKRFLLLPPGDFSHAHEYPFVHPHFAQSQLWNITGHSSDEGGRPPGGIPLHQKPAEFIEAVLSPGEMLHIPPMWYHIATALEGSVSINAWTESDQQRLYQACVVMTSQWLGEAHRAPVGHKRDLLKHLLPAVVAKALSGGPYSAMSAFVSALTRARYAALFARGELPSRVDGICDGDPANPIAEAQIEAIVKQGAVIGSKFKSIPARERLVWMQNYVESMAQWANEPLQVGAYIAACFS